MYFIEMTRCTNALNVQEIQTHYSGLNAERVPQLVPSSFPVILLYCLCVVLAHVPHNERYQECPKKSLF